MSRGHNGTDNMKQLIGQRGTGNIAQATSQNMKESTGVDIRESRRTERAERQQ
jgi:hypothetical protein